MRRFGRNCGASLWRNRVEAMVVFTIAATVGAVAGRYAAAPRA